MILYAFALALALIFSTPIYAAEDETIYVTFKHSNGTEMGPEECRRVTSGLETMTEEWYAAAQDVTIDRRLRVSGTVNLVLCSGATMTVNGGISIPDGSKLIIWAQDNETSRLTVAAEEGSGIGGEAEAMGGNVSILGGRLDVTGGDKSAGIGGSDKGCMRTIRIYGGNIKVSGGALGAGIGSGNRCDSDLYNESFIEIEGGEVTAYGGINRYYSYGKYEGGVITGGWSNGSCGGVYIDGGTFIMSDGLISGNIAALKNPDSTGGGVYLKRGTFEMTGGMMTENTASRSGGLYVHSGSFKLSGAPVIIGNNNLTNPDNVYLDSDVYISVFDELKDSARIGVNMAYPGLFTSGLKDKGSSYAFQSDDGNYGVHIDENGEAYLGDPLAVTYDTPDFVLPEGTSVVEDGAFERIAARVVYIPDSCTEIAPYAFRNCKHLRQIRIPADCIIGESTFDGCENLYVFGLPGSGAEQYCNNHDNCTFVVEAQ